MAMAMARSEKTSLGTMVSVGELKRLLAMMFRESRNVFCNKKLKVVSWLRLVDS